MNAKLWSNESLCVERCLLKGEILSSLENKKSLFRNLFRCWSLLSARGAPSFFSLSSGGSSVPIFAISSALQFSTLSQLYPYQLCMAFSSSAGVLDIPEPSGNGSKWIAKWAIHLEPELYRLNNCILK